MEKTLTISIAAYNAEQYIRKTLDSLVDEDIINDLEIYVVDDGGTDGTLKIAQEYAEKYPQCIFPVHKENGGYGSTVNYSIANAHGKYFKLLDGDDWFEKENLKEFINLLKTVETDIIITPYYRCLVDLPPQKSDSIDERTLNVDLDVKRMPTNRAYGMWAITFKTRLLLESKVQLPSHCLYTDKIYAAVPFAYAKTIRFEDNVIYCYRLGRDGQSVSRESRIKHIDDTIEVTDALCDFYEKQVEKGNKDLTYLKLRVSISAKQVIRTYLLEPISSDVLMKIKKYDCKLKKESPEMYKMLGNKSAYKSFALYMKVIRALGYGKLALLVSKIVLPKEGVRNWG